MVKQRNDAEEPLASGVLRDESTIELVRRTRAGDPRAREELLFRYRPRLVRWVSGRLPASRRSFVDTEDLVQETLLRTVSRMDSLREPAAFPVYVRQALNNRLLDELRRPERTSAMESMELEPEDPGPSPAQRAMGRELFQHYEAVLESLSSKERGALIGRIELGLPFSELADELGVSSPDAARMITNRALVRLSRRMSHRL